MAIMDSSTNLQHHQEMDSQTLESMLACSKQQPDKKPRPAEQALKCPRCDSNNTKFCYYNNYSLSQPRYFCKSCRRYWTKGGTLRNVPVGGGCRRNKRSSSSSSSSSKRSSQDQPLTPIPSPIIPGLANVPYNSNDSHDLNLAFARLQKENDHFPIMGSHQNMPHYDVVGSSGGGFFEAAMRGGFLENPFSAHSMYYAGSTAGMEMGMNGNLEMGMGWQDFGGPVAVKQEMCTAREGNEARVLWGFPWQNLAGDGDRNEVDSGRVGWNGMGSTSWHGLLNSPLM